MILNIKACTSIKEIEDELKKNKQQLAFEPIDFGYFLNGKSDFGTAAGQVSCNISGPRRFKVGSVRDHVLGFRGVNGKGEIIKSGGTVVKNVTGYDLSKLICGAYGTLVALTEITFKVLPAPEESKTLVIHNLNLEELIVLFNISIAPSKFKLCITSVLLSSGAGKTLKVISVKATKVPYAPQINLLRS
jgi:glycolate oxidase FAD binding subunit